MSAMVRISLFVAAVVAFGSTAGAQNIQEIRHNLPGPYNGPAELAARAAAQDVASRLGILDPHLDFKLEREFRTGDGGHIVRLSQTYAGLPVINSVLVVRLTAHGEIGGVRTNAVAVSGLDLKPSIDAEEARRIARASVPLLQPKDDHGQARLAVLRLPGGRLVWQIYVPTLLPIHTIHATVDAHTGEFLGWIDLAKQAQATVFKTGSDAKEARKTDRSFDNSKLSTVELKGLLTSTPGSTLVSEDIMALNCCPTEDCEEGADPKTIEGTLPADLIGFPINYRTAICHELQTAQADNEGNFFYEPSQEPARGTPVPSPSEGEEFAEVMAYHFAQSTIDYLRSVDPDFKMGADSRPLTVTANYLMPDLQEAYSQMGFPPPNPVEITRLIRFSNAMFAPKGTFDQLPLGEMERATDSVLLFQGDTHDFAYDGTITSHEVGHAVVHGSAPGALEGWVLDSWGSMDDPGAMNEGFADYFAGIVSGAPVIGAYVGADGAGGGDMRRLDNDFSCPDVLWGEVHQDSMHFSAALWTVREAVAKNDQQKKAYDRAVLDALRQLVKGDGFASTVGKVAEEIENNLDAKARSTAEAEFARRGLSSCERVQALKEGHTPRTLYIPAAADRFKPYAPAPIQFKLNPPKGATKVTLTVKGSSEQGMGGIGLPGQGNSGPQLSLHYRHELPISFLSSQGSISADASSSAPLTLAQDGSGQVKLDLNLDTSFCHNEELYFSLLNASSQSQFTLNQVSVAYHLDPAKAEDCGPEPDPNDKGNGGGEDGDNAPGSDDGKNKIDDVKIADEGCNCASGGSSLGLAALGLLALALRRKKSWA